MHSPCRFGGDSSEFIVVALVVVLVVLVAVVLTVVVVVWEEEAGLLPAFVLGPPIAANPLRSLLPPTDRYEASLGPNHPSTGTLVNNLAMLLQAKGNFTDAEPLW